MFDKMDVIYEKGILMMHELKDILSRPLKDLRISVTDQCNFRCNYCMPKEIFDKDYPFLKKDELLSFDEMTRLASLFVTLGVRKIRITGGEPLLRKNLHQLIKQLSNLSSELDIALTTNGVFLPQTAKLLKEAGLKRVNISLDALDDQVFKKMNGRQIEVKKVLNGIATAKKENLEVKINMVVQKGVNDDQILKMAHYFKDRNITLRFIEFMDVGNTNGWKLSQVVPSREIYQLIHNQIPLEPLNSNYFGEVADRYRYKGTNVEVGFISSVTSPFCHSCTRARISADGTLYTCLFSCSGVSLKKWLRSNYSDEYILEEMRKIWQKRHDRYSEMRSKFNSSKQKKIEMSYIGG